MILDARFVALLAAMIAISSCSAQQIEGRQVHDEWVLEKDFRSIEFGFNTTYLNSTFKFKPALKKLADNGQMSVRVYEPFTRSQHKDPEKSMQMLKWLHNRGFKVLLSLSNFPYKRDERLGQLSKLPPDNRGFPIKAIGYSNRYPPVNTEEYKQFLRSYLTQMQAGGIMDSFEFEVGNEPNAPRYFWGNVSDWNIVRDAAIEVLAEFGKRPLCCGYTSSMFLHTPSKDHHLPFIESFVTDTASARAFDLSFHVYLNMGERSADLKTPLIPVKKGVITEYGIFSHYSPEVAEKKNSPLYVAKISELLEFTYNNEISRVYLFPLMDDRKKKGTMGYFDGEGSPKACYSYFKIVWDVVRDGYFVERSDDRITITGRESVLIVALTSLSMDLENVVIQSTVNGSLEFGKGDWCIFVK